MHTISVIVPAYNCEKTLERCIESIIQQTYHNIEIIIVDDGSTDKTPLICDNYSNNYKNITVVHNKNGGASSARNTGISLSTGEYITFVDSDDYIRESMYQTMIDNIGNNDVIMCNFDMFKDEDGVKVDLPKLRHCMGNKAYDSQYILKNGCFEQNIAGVNMVWNKLYKAEIIKKNNIMFDKKTVVGEDLLFNIEVLSKCRSVYMLDDELYFYLIEREGSIMYNERLAVDWEAKLKMKLYQIKRAKELKLDIDVNKLYYPELMEIHNYLVCKTKSRTDVDKMVLIFKSRLYRDALRYDKLLPRGIRFMNIFTKVNPYLGLVMYKLMIK